MANQSIRCKDLIRCDSGQVKDIEGCDEHFSQVKKQREISHFPKIEQKSRETKRKEFNQKSHHKINAIVTDRLEGKQKGRKKNREEVECREPTQERRK